MLRRYLIVNATMTLVPYGVFLAFAPSAPHLLQSIVLVSGVLADR